MAVRGLRHDENVTEFDGTRGWSHYVLYMPNKEQLIAQVEAVLEKQKAIESNSTGI